MAIRHSVNFHASALIVGSALIALTAVSPAFAAPKAAPAITAPAESGGTTEQKSLPAKAPKQNYCVIMNQTGSRIAMKICRTKAEWATRGIDVDKTND